MQQQELFKMDWDYSPEHLQCQFEICNQCQSLYINSDIDKKLLDIDYIELKGADYDIYWDYDTEMYYCNLAETVICGGCYENNRYYMSTIVRYSPEGKTAVKFDEYNAIVTDDETGEADIQDFPEWFEKYYKGRKWQSIDAWRGSYESEFKNGFTQIAVGWVTGWADKNDCQTSHKVKSIEFSQFIRENRPPKPIFWLFEPTSNVFSTASEIFCDKKDLKAIEKWLKKNGYSIDDLDNSFD